MKPLIGIDNNKFQPIVRKLYNLRVELSPLNIETAKKTVDKLIAKIEP